MGAQPLHLLHVKFAGRSSCRNHAGQPQHRYGVRLGLQPELPPQFIRWFATADSIGIYLLIAGSITPFAVVALQGPWQWGTVVATWMLAGCGCALCLLFSHVPGVVSTSIYLGMGWGILVCRSQLEQSPKPIDLRLAFLGGVLYSVGAMFNLLHWPVLWPGVFAAHELFHLFVMAGSANRNPMPCVQALTGSRKWSHSIHELRDGKARRTKSVSRVAHVYVSRSPLGCGR